MGITDSIKSEVMAQILKNVHNISNENLIRLVSLAGKLTKDESAKSAVNGLKKYFEEGHISLEFAKDLIKRLSPNCRDKMIRNLLINSQLKGNERRNKFQEENGFRPPFLVVVSPSMRCNLRCKGCYAGEYTQKDDLSTEMLEKIFIEIREMGINFVVISGGEPYIRQDLFDLFKKYDDMYFLTYTNGTLITKEVAKKLAELGNVAPAISVEGFKEETDERRGEGVYDKVLQAMDNLKEAGVMFGFSATPTKTNADLLTTDKFIDFYTEKGCSFGWLFQYIPIGLKPCVELMATPEQRTALRHKVHNEWRDNKKIFIGDFWNDGCYVTGCMAGGRKYLHITCKGDIEPCVFTHFTSDNIHDTTIREALNSELFKKIREGQRTVNNLLTPCCIIDNPEILRKAVKESGAKPSHPGAETIVEDPKIREHLDNYAKRMKELADEDWNNAERYKSHREGWEKTKEKEQY